MKKKNTLEEIAEAPAEAVELATQASRAALHNLTSKRPVHVAERYWHTLGPGLTTGASDDDPSGIATYSQAGAKYGFQFLWLALFTFPLMAVVQEMCARVGLATGKGLAGNIRQRYAGWVLALCSVLLLAANIFNIGANLGAMAEAAQLIFPGAPFFPVILLFTVISLALQIFTTYERYARYLKYLALTLLLYVFATLSISDLPWREILKSTVVPQLSFNREQIFLVCAILGTTISPYLFFWQTSQEVEERMLHAKMTGHSHSSRVPRLGRLGLRRMRLDVWSGMFLSNVVMFFIITACGATLFVQGVEINTAADAAMALRPIAGDAAYLLFALGIIGTGMLAVPVLAGSASYAISESLQWKFGLYRKLKDAEAFYGVIIIAMAVGMLINLTGLDPIKALIYSAVINGLVAPIVLVFIVLLSSNREVMGRHVNNRFITVIGWLVIGLMAAAGLATIIFLF